MTRPVKHKQFRKRTPVVMRRGPVAALDIGTNKVACLIAETADDNQPNRMMRVTGFGHQVSEGLQAGQITDMRAAEDSLRAAVDAAERMAGVEVRGIIIGVSANRISSQVCEANVPLNGQAVTDDHMVLAPGTPQDAGISIELIRAATGKVPVLGVCLGHQALAAAFGGTLRRVDPPVHGKLSRIKRSYANAIQTDIFTHCPDDFPVTRYRYLKQR